MRITPEDMKERAIDDSIGTLSGKAFNDEMRDLSDEEIQRVFGNCILATRLMAHVKFMRDQGMTIGELLAHQEGSMSLNQYHKFSHRRPPHRQLSMFAK